jgi:hypothetical protein
MCGAASDVRFGPKADSCAAAKSIVYSMTSSANARSLSVRSRRRVGGSGRYGRYARQRPVSAFTRPEATAAWSAAKSRSFWSAYVSANEAMARSK